MSIIKSNNDDLVIETEGDNTIFKNVDDEKVKINADGLITSTASTASIDSVGNEAIPTKGYLSSYEHTHANKSILDSTTASYTTTEQSKLAGIYSSSTQDQSDVELEATNFTAYSVDGAILDTSTALGTYNTRIPSQNASKVYSDGIWSSHISAKHWTSTGCWGGKTAAQTVTSGVWARVAMAQINDKANNFDGSRITQSGGLQYRCSGQIMYSSVAWGLGNKVSAALYVNGSSKLRSDFIVTLADTCYVTININACIQVSSGNYIELYTFQNSGTSKAMYVSTVWNQFHGNTIIKG